MVTGDCLIELRDCGTAAEHVVVTRADSVVMASAELVEEWRAGHSSHVDLNGDMVTFGTDGEGLGVVTYRISEQVEADIIPLRRMAP